MESNRGFLSRSNIDLVVVSAFLLFLELACIRWFPAHVQFLTFFTNTVLLASFLGMSAGCMAAGRRQNLIRWTPALLVAAMALAHFLGRFNFRVQIGNRHSPEMVYFGAEFKPADAAAFAIPIELILAVFFVLVALAMLGPGQELGRALNRVSDRVRAYTFNIFGSILGITLFAALSFFELSPVWWFLPIAFFLAYLVRPYRSMWRPSLLLMLISVVVLAGISSVPFVVNGEKLQQHFWSPYYRIDYYAPLRNIEVNRMSQQFMLSRDPANQSDFAAGIAYQLPYMLRRDTGMKPPNDVLIIGAGSGNDVSRALQWGARHVDAVEIDPVIQRLGALHHPDRPYQDSRVSVHLDDGRNFLRSTDRQYDLIIFALVDSLILHSSYSDIRLESYLFTQQAFRDVRQHLKPGGMFVMYNLFRRGWIVSRLHNSLEAEFGAAPVVFALPYTESIGPETTGGFTMLFVGDTQSLSNRFRQGREYWVLLKGPVGPAAPDGFVSRPSAGEEADFVRLAPARIERENLQLATDEWPYLYLRNPKIPALSLRGAGIMIFLALVLIALMLPKPNPDTARLAGLDWRMFFLGAGFMLIETKAVVHMALLFGSTWMVNTVVFFAVLVMILCSNLFVLRFRPGRLWPYFAGLMLTLAANLLLPMNLFLGMSRTLQVCGSCLLVFSPVLFAGVIFAVSFERSSQPDRDFGMNIAGAMIGGLSEYASMLLGFKYLMLVAAAYYLSAMLFSRKQPQTGSPEQLSRGPEQASAPQPDHLLHAGN